MAEQDAPAQLEVAAEHTSSRSEPPSTALAPRRQEAGSLVPSGGELATALQVCELQVKSGYLPGHIRTKEQLFAIYLRARDMGIKLSAAIDHLYTTSKPDKPGVQVGMSAVMMRALAYRRVPGFKLLFDEVSETQCKARATRAGLGEWQHVTVTLADAAAQGLTERNPNYRTNPKGMLRADATRELIRLVAPDALALGGTAYTAGELHDHGNDAAPLPQEPITVDAANFEEVKE